MHKSHIEQRPNDFTLVDQTSVKATDQASQDTVGMLFQITDSSVQTLVDSKVIKTKAQGGGSLQVDQFVETRTMESGQCCEFVDDLFRSDHVRTLCHG